MSTFNQRQDRLKKDHYDAKEIGLALVGLVAISVAFLLYRKTSINAFVYLVLPALILGIITSLIWPKKPSAFYGRQRVFIFILGMCVNTVFWGGIYSVTLLSINTFVPHTERRISEKTPIITRSSMISKSRKERDKRRAVYTVVLNGQAKDFVFDHEIYQKLDSFNYLLVQYRSGALGFEVMEEVSPVR
jgi:dipeptide/tripeptide permease